MTFIMSVLFETYGTRGDKTAIFSTAIKQKTCFLHNLLGANNTIPSDYKPGLMIWGKQADLKRAESGTAI